MSDDTGCWKCNKPYPMFAPSCPDCGATNPNVDLDKAMKEVDQGIEENMQSIAAAVPLITDKQAELQSALATAQAEIERLRPYARRYEWLRAHSYAGDPGRIANRIYYRTEAGPPDESCALDHRIDEAMGYSAGLEEFAKRKKAERESRS